MELFTALLSGPSVLEFYLRAADAGTVTSIFFSLIAGFFVIALVLRCPLLLGKISSSKEPLKRITR
ncbi:hypothetical protein [Halomonas sp. KO116]|uniref:hypothetical protein n=1 Tax=Halomonas sp. KO116 TaxID=1504981 RepID=UPI0004E295FB|nr:hypothetical protein [Halomonas sp. KO116]AJY51537.1 hypothetical protein KO116_03064 [Halomonas sp. KO116]